MSKSAQLRVLSYFITIGSKGWLKVFSSMDGSCLFSNCHEFDSTAKDGNSNPLDEKLEDLCVSGNERYLAALYSDKSLIIVDTQKWFAINTIKVKRRPTAMTFEPDNEHILVADKSGDVYRYHVTYQNPVRSESDSDETIGPSPIIGHVSMLLDINTTLDGKYILTADRDEKIRVSCLKFPFVIESFCLGHTEFVTNIEPLSHGNENFILSSSGDSTIRLWNAVSGKDVMNCNVLDSVTRSTDDEMSDCKMIPSIVSISDDHRIFLVSSNQAQFPNVLLYKLDLTNQNFSYLTQFYPANCQRTCDVKFSPASRVIHVLSVSGDDEKLCLSSYSAQNGIWKSVEDCDAVTSINAQLKECPVECSNTWTALFKIRGEGQGYESYFKKKSDRSSGKNLSSIDSEVASKRAKLVESVTT